MSNRYKLSVHYLKFFFFVLVFQSIRLKAGFALSIFAFNNTPQQYSIREAGGIRYECFQSFLESDNDFEICNAAFQVS